MLLHATADADHGSRDADRRLAHTLTHGDTLMKLWTGMTVRQEMLIAVVYILRSNPSSSVGEALARVVDGAEEGTIAKEIERYADDMSDAAWKRFKLQAIKAAAR